MLRKTYEMRNLKGQTAVNRRTSVRRGRPATGADPAAPRILAAAREVFATQGYEGASLRLITDQAGVDVAMVARAFGSKLDLWKAVVDDIAMRVVPALDAICAESKQGLSKDIIEEGVSNLIDLVTDVPFLAQFVVAEFVRDCERSVHVYERLALPIHQSIQRLVGKARKAGRDSDSSPHFLASSLLATIAIMIATRPMMTRIWPKSLNEDMFKQELRRAILQQLGVSPQ